MKTDVRMIVANILKVVATFGGVYFAAIGLFGLVGGSGVTGKVEGWIRFGHLGYLLVGCLFIIPNYIIYSHGLKKIYLVISILPTVMLVMIMIVFSGFVERESGDVISFFILLLMAVSAPLSAYLYNPEPRNQKG